MDPSGTGTSSAGTATPSSSAMMDPTAVSSYNPNPSSSSPSTSSGNYFDLSNYATSSSSSTAAAAAVNGHHSSDLYAAAALMASYSSTYPHRSHFPPTNSSCSSSSSSTTTTASTSNARITDEIEAGSHGHFSNGVHYSSGPSQSAYFSYPNPATHPPSSASFDPHNHFYANPFAGFLDQKHALLPASLSCYDHHSASTNY